MSKYKVPQIKKTALWRAYNQRCFYCKKLIPFKFLEIDHILPEYLLSNYEKVQAIKDEYGLDKNFEINSYYNWLPACYPCNRDKGGTIPKKETALFWLQIAAQHYRKIEKIEQCLEKNVKRSKINSLLNVNIERRLISFREVEDSFLSLGTPSNSDTLFEYIVNNFCSLIEDGKFKEAVTQINKALHIFPDEPTGFGYYSRGCCYLHLEEYDKAIRDCTKAISIEPKLDSAHFVKGQAYFIPYYKNLIRKNTEDDIIKRIHRFRDGCVAIDDCHHAINSYTNTLEINPKHSDSYYWRAICRIYMMVRFWVQFCDCTITPAKIIEDLQRAAETYYSQSKLPEVKDVLNTYSDFTNFYKDFSNINEIYGNASQFLHKLNSEYFSEFNS
jgi:tetratricopeptide (TPR) repeat protein